MMQLKSPTNIEVDEKKLDKREKMKKLVQSILDRN